MTDISGSSNQASLDLSRTTGETFTFEGDFSIKKSCKKSVSLSLQAVYTQSDTEASNILSDWYFNGSGARTVQIDVPNGSSGSDRYSGEFELESLSIPLVADDAAPILMSASLTNSGAVTRAAIAS